MSSAFSAIQPSPIFPMRSGPGVTSFASSSAVSIDLKVSSLFVLHLKIEMIHNRLFQVENSLILNKRIGIHTHKNGKFNAREVRLLQGPFYQLLLGKLIDELMMLKV